MTRAMELCALVLMGCARSVQPCDAANCEPVHADGASAGDSSSSAGDADAEQRVVCADGTAIFTRPENICLTHGLRCTDGTTRASRCSVSTQRCACSIIGGASYTCEATTGYTPGACEDVRNCCWQ